MIFEMTLDYNVIIPMTITVAISYGVRKLLQPESIYTLKLTRRGRLMPESLRADLQPTRLARDVMDTRFAPVSADTGLEALMSMAGEQPTPECFLVRGSEHVAGVLMRRSLPGALSGGDDKRRVGEVPSDRFVVVSETAPVIEVLAHMRGQGANVALVTGQGAGDRIRRCARRRHQGAHRRRAVAHQGAFLRRSRAGNRKGEPTAACACL